MNTPWMLGLAAVCSVMSYGLMYRKRWMWYGGWVVLYFLAAGLGNFFFDALLVATTTRQVVWAWVYFTGGLVLWMPTTVYWSRIKGQFDGRRPR
jgi:uncharacterized membrane protein (DUF485 family)